MRRNSSPRSWNSRRTTRRPTTSSARCTCARRSQAADNPALFEKCRYTEILAPFALEQPESDPVSVRFVDATSRAFGSEAGSLRGPFGLMDLNRRGWNDLLLTDTTGALRLLWNSNAVFAARSEPLPSTVGVLRDIVVGDLNNDRYDDALLLGTEGAQLLKFATNGFITDGSALGGIRAVKGTAAALADLDITGKLGLLAIAPDGRLRSFTNFGTAIFRERRGGSNDAFGIQGASEITVDDWNNDDLPDVLVTRPGRPPFVLTNRRRDGLTATNQPANWPIASALAVGDFNNDLRSDVVLVTPSYLSVHFGGLHEPKKIPARKNGIRTVRALDYDNDGWLDLVTWGADGLRIWRNRGRRGFHEETADLGLEGLSTTTVRHAAFADFDQDGDIDGVLDTGDTGLRFLRNDGAHVNGLVKFRPIGNRSNFSGIGLRLELNAGSWRALRTVQRKPVEIGVGKHKDIETVIARWADTQPLFGVTADPKQVDDLIEPKNPTGSEAHSTSKLVPGRPVPDPGIRLGGGRLPVRSATAGGRDITALLAEADGSKHSPTLRGPQLRGLAEPESVLLDFGPLPDEAGLTLALTGWIRFGGGMANIAGSHDPELPFPFPVLDAEAADGSWKAVPVTVGSPAGKTKTILVQIGGKLPGGTRRLRLSYAFELHWDRTALFRENRPATVGEVRPTRSHLHWRGYSDFQPLPDSEPLTPVYESVRSRPPWRITPSGWATRYGSVDELVQAEDNGLATIAGGDELTLQFEAGGIPAVAAGTDRRYFLWTVGWDKDADYHVAEGNRIEPLPWHGMDDQRHGTEARPGFRSDALHQRFNSRWVGPRTYERASVSGK